MLTSGLYSDQIMSPHTAEALESLGKVEWNVTGRTLTQEEVLERIPGCTAVFTTWGAPN